MLVDGVEELPELLAPMALPDFADHGVGRRQRTGARGDLHAHPGVLLDLRLPRLPDARRRQIVIESKLNSPIFPPMRIASRTFVGFTVAVLAACASGRGGAVTRSQVDVTIPGAPATASARVLSAFADAQFPAERAEASILAAEVPLTEQDQGGRAGTRVMVQAALIPAATDSTRVVLTGRILVPAAGDLPAQTIPVTSANHPEYGKTNRQGWAAMERIERTLRGRR